MTASQHDGRTRATLAGAAVVERQDDGRRAIVRRRGGRRERLHRDPLAQRGDHVGRIFGRGGQAGVFEAVDAGFQAAADLLGSVRMRHRSTGSTSDPPGGYRPSEMLVFPTSIARSMSPGPFA